MEEQNISESGLELAGFMAEMQELISNGTLRHPDDFELWLEDVESECRYCYSDLKQIVNHYIIGNA